MSKRKKSMFYSPARHRGLGEIVTLESPTKARRAARELRNIFRKANRRDKKREVKQSTVLAANRAKAMRKKRNLSKKEKRELEEIAEIYEKTYKEMEL